MQLPEIRPTLPTMTAVEAYTLNDPGHGKALTHVVFSSPHSGRSYPESLIERSQLGLLRLRASEDAYVDDLFGEAPRNGAPLISGTAPRAYLDLNRAPDELDPALIQGVRSSGVNQRVLAGLGVVPRVVAEGSPIYNGKIRLSEARQRISDFHTPFHLKLERLLHRARETFGSALLIDCHSMPTEALRAAPKVGGITPQIVLGDRFGASSDRSFIVEVQAAFERAGFVVARNAPFAGGYITQRYGKPAQGLNAIQVEIDRGLYLDQKLVEPSPAFDEIKRLLTRVIADLVKASREPQKFAAE